MPNKKLVVCILLIVGLTLTTTCIAETNKVYYSGHPFDPEIIPSGMIPYDDNGYTHGSLFSTPIWLLRYIDPDMMSTVLDQGEISGPLIIPEQYQKPDFVFQNPVKLKMNSPFTSIKPSEGSQQTMKPFAGITKTPKYSPFSNT